MVKTIKKVFSILTVLCMMMGILSITAFATDITAIKVDHTSSPVIIGGNSSDKNFFVVVKQAQAFSCWTAVDITNDVDAQEQIKDAVLAANNNGNGQDSDPWEFHYFDLNHFEFGQPFYVFNGNNGSDESGSYGGKAVINYTGGELTFTMNVDKWSHLLYGTYGSGSVTPQTGSLIITKAIGSGNQYGAASDTYTVSIDGPEDTAYHTYGSVTFDGNRHAVVTVAVGTDTEITDLPVGDYTITETGAGQDGYALSTSYNNTVGTSGTVTLTQNSTATMAIVNTYTTNGSGETPTGALTITKTIGAGNAYENADSATYTVSIDGPEDTAYHTYGSVTFDGNRHAVVTVAVGTDTEITDLPVGDYTITETGAGQDGYALSTSYNNTVGTSGTVTLTQNSTATMAIVNTYTTNGSGETPTGALTITKNVTGVGDTDADQAHMKNYSVMVIYAEGKSVTFAGDDFSYDSTASRWTASTTLTLDESTTYSVSEGSIPTLNGYTSPSAATISGGDDQHGAGTVDANQTDSVTLVNAYTANGGGGGSETPNNPGPGTTTTTEITDPETPLGEVPSEPTVTTEPTEPTEEIADEPVALASVPQTGDMSALWFALSGFSAVGLAGAYVLGRKRTDNSAQ